VLAWPLITRLLRRRGALPVLDEDITPDEDRKQKNEVRSR